MSKYKHEAKIELSKDIIEYLHDTTGDNYAQIGRKIGLSRSLICSISKGQRILTLENLLKLERAYEIPLPVILLKNVKDKNVPEKLRPLYGTAKELLNLLESNSLEGIF